MAQFWSVTRSHELDEAYTQAALELSFYARAIRSDIARSKLDAFWKPDLLSRIDVVERAMEQILEHARLPMKPFGESSQPEPQDYPEESQEAPEHEERSCSI